MNSEWLLYNHLLKKFYWSFQITENFKVLSNFQFKLLITEIWNTGIKDIFLPVADRYVRNITGKHENVDENLCFRKHLNVNENLCFRKPFKLNNFFPFYVY